MTHFQHTHHEECPNVTKILLLIPELKIKYEKRVGKKEWKWPQPSNECWLGELFIEIYSLHDIWMTIHRDIKVENLDFCHSLRAIKWPSVKKKYRDRWKRSKSEKLPIVVEFLFKWYWGKYFLYDRKRSKVMNFKFYPIPSHYHFTADDTVISNLIKSNIKFSFLRKTPCVQ